MMPESEQEQQRETAQQQERTAAAKAESAGKAALCKNCGAPLDPEFPFCPECGERAGGEELSCEFCQTRTTREFCPQCGRRVVPVNCPSCGTPSIYDVCGNCGAVLNPALEAALARETPPEAAVMSAEETAKVAAMFKELEENESPEFKAFQKKLIERQIHLDHRDHFNKREKRILKAFGNRPFSLELPDPGEEAFRMRAYAALEKMVLAREKKAIDAELEKMFPAAQAQTLDAADVERSRAKMEQEFQFRVKFGRGKFDGVYYWGNPASDYEYIKIKLSENEAQCMHHCGGHGDSYGIFHIDIDGENLTFNQGSMSAKGCPLMHSAMHTFTGKINNTGTVLSGFWDAISVTHYKV
ncbi:MAG: zinc-ribbon domain-containing protein [Treponema sp.]|jgi:predicted amidophosphoribosyltransferase|nr:zinc-ribbon domain-containing protein [Treponema sp.]